MKLNPLLEAAPAELLIDAERSVTEEGRSVTSDEIWKDVEALIAVIIIKDGVSEEIRKEYQ